MSIINRVFTAPNNDQYGHFSGPTCVIQLFYKSNLSILTQKCSTRKKSWQITVNAEIHGFCEFCHF